MPGNLGKNAGIGVSPSMTPTFGNIPTVSSIPPSLPAAPTGGLIPPISNYPNASNASPIFNNSTNKRELVATNNNSMRDVQQMATQILHGQMDVQEQVLQYQFMLEQCMSNLDHQNLLLSQQQEELSVLKAKIKHMDYMMEALKYKGTTNPSPMPHYSQPAGASWQQTPYVALLPPSSSYYSGGATRATPSTFQPTNPHYKSPTRTRKSSGRSSTTSDINRRVANDAPRSTG
ncbi:unnamed protein product, partial [Didymodactylos carnosus]